MTKKQEDSVLRKAEKVIRETLAELREPDVKYYLPDERDATLILDLIEEANITIRWGR